MLDSRIQDTSGKAGETPSTQGQPAPETAGTPATLAGSLAAGLSEFFTRRRQSRPGLYAPLVRIDRSE